MERIAAKMGGTIKWPYNDSQCLDADYFKIVADHLLTEAGVRPILHCLAVEVMLENNRIIGVITESKSGRLRIRAKRVIDCTGDADVAYLAGCSFRKTSKDVILGVFINKLLDKSIIASRLDQKRIGFSLYFSHHRSMVFFFQGNPAL
jgi:hypothetical protein